MQRNGKIYILYGCSLLAWKLSRSYHPCQITSILPQAPKHSAKFCVLLWHVFVSYSRPPKCQENIIALRMKNIAGSVSHVIK